MKIKYSLLLTVVSALILNLFGTKQVEFTTTRSAPDIYHEGWIDLNKNGKKDIYEDPKVDIEAQSRISSHR